MSKKVYSEMTRAFTHSLGTQEEQHSRKNNKNIQNSTLCVRPNVKVQKRGLQT